MVDAGVKKWHARDSDIEIPNFLISYTKGNLSQISITETLFNCYSSLQNVQTISVFISLQNYIGCVYYFSCLT